MAKKKYPSRFRKLLETNAEQVTLPTLVILAFAVCGIDIDSCGWNGWIIESVHTGDSSNNEIPALLSLPSADNQKCPNCGKITFRTGVAVKFLSDGTAMPCNETIVAKMEYE